MAVREIVYLQSLVKEQPLFIPAKQRAKRELARIWRLPRGSNTPPLWGELAKKKLSHAPLLAAGYLILTKHMYGRILFQNVRYCGTTL